jgi:PAS domain S-box-containing protein
MTDSSPGVPASVADRADPLADGLDRLFMLSSALLCIAGTDGYFKRVNPAFEKTLGHTDAVLLSRPFIDFVHPDDCRGTLDEISKLSLGKPAVHFENRYRHADGSYRYLLWNATPVTERGSLYATALDITERKQRELELVEHQRKLQVLTARLVLAEESERRRIAIGLHDDVGQALAAAQMNLGELLEADLPGDADSSAQEAQRLVGHAIQTTRTLTFELASAALYEVGLGAAVQSLCQRAEQDSGIQFEAPLGLPGNPIPEQTRIVLYRATRELIRNIVMHSKARTASLSLSLSGSRIRLEVADDGCGFETAKSHDGQHAQASIGLFSISQQLDPLGGRLEIDSSPGSGTRAVMTVPLEPGQDRT